MPYKYKIDVYQLTNKTTYSGEMDSLNEVSVILKQVEKKLVKDETARITFTYTEINEKNHLRTCQDSQNRRRRIWQGHSEKR